MRMLLEPEQRRNGFRLICYIDDSHNPQAIANHGQTLAKLNRRGGLSPAEAIAIIEDRKFQVMTDDECLAWFAKYEAGEIVETKASVT